MGRVRVATVLFVSAIAFSGVAVTSSLIYLRAKQMLAAAPEGPALVRAYAELGATHAYAMGTGAVLSLVFCAVGLWALRIQETARLAYGRAERLSTTAQLAAIVAHEVRNPLQTIRAGVELLGERARIQGGDDARGRELTREILEEVDRLNRLTQDFLLLAREAPLHRTPLDLGGMLYDVAGSVGRRLPEAQIEVSVADALPVVHGDADALRRVFANLVQNAAQASGGAGVVRLSAEAAANGVAIRVVDDGPGVSEAARARLFEPWSSAREGGTGLGLSLSRSIVERHGGKLSLETTTRGAAFRVFLRAGDAEV